MSKLEPEVVAPMGLKPGDYLLVPRWQAKLLMLVFAAVFFVIGSLFGIQTRTFEMPQSKEQARSMTFASYPMIRPILDRQERELYPLYCITQAAKLAPWETIEELLDHEAMCGWDGREEEFKKRMEARIAANDRLAAAVSEAMLHLKPQDTTSEAK